MKKYQPSNQNVAPPAERVETWASVIEIMVSFALFLAAMVYLTVPAMIGAYVFEMFTSGVTIPKGADDIVMTITQADAKELVWLCAFFVKLSGSVCLYFIAYSVFTMLGWKNVRFIVNSLMLTAIASGDILRAVTRSIPLPEGADKPVLFLSGWVDIPGIATTGFLEGMQHSVLAPFMFVGVAGIVMGLYRLSKKQLEKKIGAYKSRK